VFIFTDGYGDNVSPEKPERWHWFLDDHSSEHCIPKKSLTFKLNEFAKESYKNVE